MAVGARRRNAAAVGRATAAALLAAAQQGRLDRTLAGNYRVLCRVDPAATDTFGDDWPDPQSAGACDDGRL
jgi:hypothetical protein